MALKAKVKRTAFANLMQKVSVLGEDKYVSLNDEELKLLVKKDLLQVINSSLESNGFRISVVINENGKWISY